MSIGDKIARQVALLTNRGDIGAVRYRRMRRSRRSKTARWMTSPEERHSFTIETTTAIVPDVGRPGFEPANSRVRGQSPIA